MGYYTRMKGMLKRLMSLLLCLVIFTGAVACSGEKGASGQKVAPLETQQAKTVVTNGKYREKSPPSPQCTSEKVVADNNALAIVAAGNSAAAAGSGAVAGAVGQGSQYQANNTSDGLDMAGSCEGTREQCAVRDPSRDGTRGPGHTELPIAEQDPTGGKLVNPDQSDEQGATHTGNDAGAPGGISHTGNTEGDNALNNNGWTTTTPVPGGPTQDDLFYLNEKIPGLENVRPENPGYPANQSVIDKMNDPKFITWIGNTTCTDCSDIAPKLLDAATGQGKIIEVRPVTPGSNLTVYENGEYDHEQSFHQVYTDGKYVYDPRLSLKPIPKGDWEKHIKSINQGNVTISDKLQGLK